MQSDGSPHFLRVPQERPMYHSTSSPRTFTVRGIIRTEERTFRGWVTHKYTKSHDRLANANKAAAPRTGARGSGADAQKLHHTRRIAAAERRASVSTESRAAGDGEGRRVGCQ